MSEPCQAAQSRCTCPKEPRGRVRTRFLKFHISWCVCVLCTGSTAKCVSLIEPRVRCGLIATLTSSSRSTCGQCRCAPPTHTRCMSRIPAGAVKENGCEWSVGAKQLAAAVPVHAVSMDAATDFDEGCAQWGGDWKRGNGKRARGLQFPSERGEGSVPVVVSGRNVVEDDVHHSG